MNEQYSNEEIAAVSSLAEQDPDLAREAVLIAFQKANCDGCYFSDPEKVGTGQPCCTRTRGPDIESHGICQARREGGQRKMTKEDRILKILNRWVSGEITTEQADRELQVAGVRLPCVKMELYVCGPVNPEYEKVMRQIAQVSRPLRDTWETLPESTQLAWRTWFYRYCRNVLDMDHEMATKYGGHLPQIWGLATEFYRAFGPLWEAKHG